MITIAQYTRTSSSSTWLGLGLDPNPNPDPDPDPDPNPNPNPDHNPNPNPNPKQGVPAENITNIYNGTDTKKFKRTPEMVRLRVRLKIRFS